MTPRKTEDQQQIAYSQRRASSTRKLPALWTKSVSRLRDVEFGV
jgi:hypothetical protein